MDEKYLTLVVRAQEVVWQQLMAAAAVGTETSGSILSPSWQNSIIGLKPTTGLLSRSGIIPISSTLDTPGPMTKNVTDSGILLSAMSGEDKNDPATKNNPKNKKVPR
jgi:amidase